ncbi:MAG: hypothetical protein ABH829_05695 [archaeon]
MVHMTEVSCPDCQNKIKIDKELSEEPTDISCPECLSDLRVTKNGDDVTVRSIEEAELLGVVKKDESKYSDSAFGQYD